MSSGQTKHVLHMIYSSDLLQLFKFFSILQQPGHHRKHTGSSDNEQKITPTRRRQF